MKAEALLYLKAAERTIASFLSEQKMDKPAGQSIEEILKKTVFYLIRYINTKPKTDFTTMEDVEAALSLQTLALQFIAQMTPKQFLNIFPIRKFYKGSKYSTKDYYTTKKMLSKVDMNSPIGDKVIDFLWDYANDDIEEFLVRYMVTVSKLRRFEGKPSLAEEMAKELGLKTYRLYQSSNGKKFLLDEKTGRTIRVKERPKHLKLIKGRGRGESKIL